MTPLARKFYLETVAAVIAADVDGYEDREYVAPTPEQQRHRQMKQRHWRAYDARRREKGTHA